MYESKRIAEVRREFEAVEWGLLHVRKQKN
jgi:hypothetical protein